MLLSTLLAFLILNDTSASVQNSTPFDQINTEENHLFLKEAIHHFLDCGYSSWLTYGELNEEFTWKVIPFKGEKVSLYDQAKAFFDITLSSIIPLPQKADAFCETQVIQTQRIFEGQTINVLYNYAPHGKWHFLIVPKRRVAQFLELSNEEYLEAEHLAALIASYYPTLNGHLLDKNGVPAGQTVPHWHQHLILTEPGNQWLDKLKFLNSMMFGKKILPKEELEQRVKNFHDTLGLYLKEQTSK